MLEEIPVFPPNVCSDVYPHICLTERIKCRLTCVHQRSPEEVSPIQEINTELVRLKILQAELPSAVTLAGGSSLWEDVISWGGFSEESQGFHLFSKLSLRILSCSGTVLKTRGTQTHLRSIPGVVAGW